MITGLTITFDDLERYNGPVTIDCSGVLTVVVGPNGSGKSTVLEAAAEVLTFLHTYPIEGPIEEVRRRISTQRSTRPSWSRATVTIELDDTDRLAIGSLSKHLKERPSDKARVSLLVTKRANDPQRHVIESLSLENESLAFDTGGKGDIFVDGVRRKEATEELNQLEAFHINKINELQNQLDAQRNTSPRNERLVATLESKLRQAQADHNSQAYKEKREGLLREVEAAKNDSIPLATGGLASKKDIEAFRASINLPRIVYLQGWPDFAKSITQMSTRLGELKDKPRSERPQSAYHVMCERLHAFLKMDVTIDRNNGYTLLIDDRPISEVSLGTWLALGFAAICETAEENVMVIWDEPESGLHPTWARKICDLMLQGPRRFLIATHRTEFVPVSSPGARVYKTMARSSAPGDKVICSLHNAGGLLDAFSIAATLGMEPSRVLFTANAVIWIEGPSDLIYWRFWLGAVAKERNVDLVEGFDYCFMFSGGSLLANETMASEVTRLPIDKVNMLRLVGASLAIVDTDFNPDDQEHVRVSRDQLRKLCTDHKWAKGGFVYDACRPHLKPRVRALLEAVDELRRTDNLSTVISTWGREAENGLSNISFRRTVKKIYNVSDHDAEAGAVDSLSVDDWRAFDKEIESAFAPHIGREEMPKLWTEGRSGKRMVALMTAIEDKCRFAETYVDVMRNEGLGSVRPELRGIIEFVFDWILKVKGSYCQ